MFECFVNAMKLTENGNLLREESDHIGDLCLCRLGPTAVCIFQESGPLTGRHRYFSILNLLDRSMGAGSNGASNISEKHVTSQDPPSIQLGTLSGKSSTAVLMQ